MPGGPAIFIAPITNRQLRVNVEKSNEDNSSVYRIFFEGKDHPLTSEEENSLTKLFPNQTLAVKDQRTYLPCNAEQYDGLLVKGPGLFVADPMAAGRRLKKRRATRRAKKHTRRSRS